MRRLVDRTGVVFEAKLRRRELLAKKAPQRSIVEASFLGDLAPLRVPAKLSGLGKTPDLAGRYAVLLPTIVNRSLSVGILELHAIAAAGSSNRPGRPDVQRVLPALPRLGSPHYQAAEFRGIALDGDCIRLTPRGRNFAGFTNWFALPCCPTTAGSWAAMATA
jgi:hypothetical protein